MKTIAAGFIILTVLGATGSWFLSGEPLDATELESSDRTALPVKTMPVEAVTSIIRARQFTGTVIAGRRSRLAFERSARLTKVMFDEGQPVKAGEVVATIDQRQLVALVSELKAQIQQQTAVLAELNSGPRTEVIASAKADLAALTADVELKKATFDRAEGLFERRATSAQARDEVRLDWKATVARREAIERKLDELQAGTRTEKIAAQKAVIAGLSAKLEQLQIDVDDSQLSAPFSGTIVNRFADEGDMLTAQQPVLELLETSKLEARIGVPSALVHSLDRTGYVVLNSGQTEVTGKIRSVIAQVDPATRTQTVVIDIDDAEHSALADGSLIRLSFDETQPVKGFRVPLTALASGSRGLWSVYVIEPTKTDEAETLIAARAVEVLHTDGDFAIVRGAIYEDERIIADGVHKVVPGQRVSAK